MRICRENVCVPDWTRMPLRWGRTDDGAWPYDAESGHHVLRIRVNDFPAEHLYSLFVDDVHVEDLDDWPETWVKPPPAAG